MTIEVGPRRYAHESIPVPMLRDERISYRARGIASRLLTNAPGFRMSAIDLARQSPNEGRTAVLTAMKELRKFGYAKVFRIQDEKGHWRTVTRVSGWPEYEPEPKSGKPTSVEPKSREPASRDRTPKSSSTKKSFQEETTTTSVTLDWSAIGLKAFTDEDRIVVVGLFNGHNPQTQQALLDEIAGYIEDKVVKNSPMGLLGNLVDAAHNGKFVLNRGRRIRDARIARATPVTKPAPGENTESKFERDVNYARQRFAHGGYEPDEDEFNRLIAKAVSEWPEEAKRHPVAALTYGKRDMHKQSKHNRPTMQGASP